MRQRVRLARFIALRRALSATASGGATRRGTKMRHLGPQMAQAYRLLRAASRLGVPGSIPGPPELLPVGARVLAQGYLNRFAMPMLNGWLLPRWMREQSDPRCDWFVPRSVSNLMVNQTRRNWTALGLPGHDHPVESLVDPSGMLTPVPGGPSLDWWVDVDGGTMGRLAATLQPPERVLQTMQGGLPVVATSFEVDGLRVSSEAWMHTGSAGDGAMMQVVLFNIADISLTGTFYFALRPYNAEGISPIYTIEFDGSTLVAGGRAGPRTWPAPEGWALSGVRGGDLFGMDGPALARAGLTRALHDPHGFAHGLLRFSFNIEPWEEAEFLAYCPVYSPPAMPAAAAPRRTFALPLRHDTPPEGPPERLDPASYSRAKAATTLAWRAQLDSGMKVELPHRDLQASWDANRAHLLALHDGDTLTPGPDLYHSFWLRDAAYMAHALSVCGFRDAAVDALYGFVRRQRRDGAFLSHTGEWDGPGQVLWALEGHLALHPDAGLLADFRPAVEAGARWIARTLHTSPGGLMPPGISSEHLGPSDRYYWDDLWSLAGLRAAGRLLGGHRAFERAAIGLRRRIAQAWAADMAASQSESLVAAPGRRFDFGAVGTLAAWFPLGLVPPDSPMLEATLSALEELSFLDGALFVGTGHSGWGTYLNMRVAGCRLLQGSPRAWDLMSWLLRHASPSYNWPEAIHPRSGGGSAGDGQHGWASAEWLMLVRSLLVTETESGLLITPALPEEWLRREGEIVVEGAPTRFGPLSYRLNWTDDGAEIRLDARPEWRFMPGELAWRVLGEIRRAVAGGRSVEPLAGVVTLPAGANTAEVTRS